MIHRLRSIFILFAIAIFILFLPLLCTTTKIAGNFGDVYLHYYPLKGLVAEHVISGRLPSWNPYIFAGQPLLANPQSAVFYPGSILFLVFGLPFAFNWFTILHFMLASVFAFLFLASRGFKNTGSLTGALSYSFSSFLIYKVPSGHPVALSGYIWLPLVMLGADRVRDRKDLRWTIFLGIVLSIQFLSGHTFPFYISAIYLLLHLAYHRFTSLRAMLWCGGIALTTAAAQFIPTFELSRVSETTVWSALTASYSLPPKNLVNMLMPNFYGNIIDGTFVNPFNPSFFFERHALYFGVIPLLLAGYGLFYSVRDRKYFFPILAATGLLLSFGFYTPFYRVLYHVLPGIGYLRVPARFYILVVASGAFCAAVAWQRLFTDKNKILKIVVCVLVAAELLWWGKHFIYAEGMDNYRKKSEIATAISPLYRIITQPERLPSNKTMLYHDYNLNGYEAVFLEDFVRYLGLQEKQVFGTTGLARVDLVSPLARGLSAGYVIAVDSMPGMPLAAALPDGLKIYATKDPLPRICFPRAVKVIPDSQVYDQISYLHNTEYPPNDEIMVGRPLQSTTCEVSKGRILSFSVSGDRLNAEIVKENPGPVVFSEIAYSGWKAYAHRKEIPVLRGNKALRMIFLEPGLYQGDNKVYMIFRPLSLLCGIWISLISLAFISVILIQYTLRFNK